MLNTIVVYVLKRDQFILSLLRLRSSWWWLSGGCWSWTECHTIGWILLSNHFISTTTQTESKVYTHTIFYLFLLVAVMKPNKNPNKNPISTPNTDKAVPTAR